MILIGTGIHAQDFGFGFDEESGGGSGGGDSLLPFTLAIGGEINAGAAFFYHDFKGEESAEPFSIWDVLSAKTNFTVSGKNAEAFIGLNFSNRAFAELKDGGPGPVYPPMLLDELWMRGYFDKLNVEAGFIKLRWGRMYSPGPLDIVNPLDYSDLTNLTDSMAMKIARPMIHASYNVTDFSMIEAVFLPNFASHRFAQDGRWTPLQYSNMNSVFSPRIMSRALEKYSGNLGALLMLQPLLPAIESGFTGYHPDFPDTSTIDYFQTGLRFNTVIGQADCGVQYFYGNYFRPSVSISNDGIDPFFDDLTAGNLSSPPYTGNPSLLSPHIEYSRYHQIGVDYSQVLFGFTVRSEFAAHITEDIKGDNGKVKNPFLAWSLGFDRDIIAGFNVNIQCNETIRLLDSKVVKDPAIDCEGGDDVSSTRLIVQLSKNLFRDKMECKLVTIWDIEDKDCVLIPSVAWLVNDARLELSAGFFVGDIDGELGQYWNNSYVKLVLSYSF